MDDQLEKAISELKAYNKWRRGAETPHPDPIEVGKAIDTLVGHYEKGKEATNG